jgi:hypothetical protein
MTAVELAEFDAHICAARAALHEELGAGVQVLVIAHHVGSGVARYAAFGFTPASVPRFLRAAAYAFEDGGAASEKAQVPS